MDSLTARIVALSSSKFFYVSIKKEESACGYLYKDSTTEKFKILPQYSATMSMLYSSVDEAYQALQEYANQRGYKSKKVYGLDYVFTPIPSYLRETLSKKAVDEVLDG